MDLTVGIVGHGFVGKATALLETEDTKMLIYDNDPSKCRPQGLTLSDLSQCDLIFVCVPTPSKKNGQVCLDIVHSVVSELNKLVDRTKTCIIIRSTVIPGTSDCLDCWFMPEFLTEKNWESDVKSCQQWLVGYPPEISQKVLLHHKVSIKRFLTSAYNHNKITSTVINFRENSVIEMVKYTRNAFLAVKVSFFNEISNYCRATNINYDDVRALTVLDNRIGESHTHVPGHDGHYGYGGTCLPKDINALLYDMERRKNIRSYILDACVERNEKVDRSEKDWLQDTGRTIVKD